MALSIATSRILLNAGCGKAGAQGAARPPSPATVVVQTAERRQVPVITELLARTQAVATVEIRANVEGRLTEMSFKEGNMVRKGQMLFQIDPRRYDAEVQSAGAVVEKAEADLEMAREQQHLVNAQSALRQAEAALLKAGEDAERIKPLAARRAVPQRDLDAAIAVQSFAAASVEAALDKAQLDREETAIRAPINGLIGTVEVSVGNYVGRGESNRLATISQLDPINVAFGISEALYLRTVDKVDRKALEHIDLILPDNSQYPFQGRYTNIGRAVDEKTGTLQIEARFQNPKGILVPGMSARVRVALESRTDAVLPEQALFDAQGSKAVYIVTPDSKVALRSVVTGGSYQGKSIITKGLDGGESVIIEGTAGVRPGQPVTTQTAQAVAR